jgi:hypothetical protein
MNNSKHVHREFRGRKHGGGTAIGNCSETQSGLPAKEVDPLRSDLSNFPQAYSYAGLINGALSVRARPRIVVRALRSSHV